MELHVMPADAEAKFRLTSRLATLSFALLLVCVAPRQGFSQTMYDTSPPAQTGEQIYGSYFSTDIDTVGLFNGNLHVGVGLLSRTGRELSTSLGFSYNNQKWENTTPSSWPSWNLGRYAGRR